MLASCRKDFDFKTSSGELSFSKDTVYLDTIFTNIGSSTYTLKVYNNENEDIVIPRVGLKNGNTSAYRLNVDGLTGKEFIDIPILAKDSMFIFIETTFDIAAQGETEFLHTDAIEFENTGMTKTVELVTLVKDAVFLYPQTLDSGIKENLLLGLDEDGNEIRIEGFFLEDDELDFTNEKPYVVYGYAAVPENSTLTMASGTRVHFHKNSGLLVTSGARLVIQGALSEDSEILENEVILEGDRLEPDFANVPGQWGAIWIANGSSNNQIDHLTLKNATIGLLVEGSVNAATTLTLNNSQIYNSSNTNLWAITAAVTSTNTVFGNAGSISLYCNLGGTYSFKHCTVANYWTNGFRNSPALFIDNFIEDIDGNQLSGDLQNATFQNCVIDGNRNIELLFASNGTNDFDFNFVNCAVKFDDFNQTLEGDPLFDFTNGANFESPFLNLDTQFADARNNDFRLLENSEIRGLGNLDIAIEVPFDAKGMDRTVVPDLGAFQFAPIE